jgi:hypothetical protein
VTSEKWEPNPRDVLIDKVRRGELSPKEAEAEAEAKGFGPMAETADPEQFNPLRMPWWTLPMAVAWIAWRDAALVQNNCADYRKHCTHWVGRSWTVPTSDGKSFESFDGWELERWTPTTLVRLAIQEGLERTIRTSAAGERMTVAQAEKDLWAALGEGKLIAVAKKSGEDVVEIPKREWSYLKHYEENDQDVMKFHPLDSPSTYTEITLARADLMRLWQAWPIENHMIEPMTRRGTAGYVPLSSALLWICTRGGTRKVDLSDVEVWEQSVAELVPFIATGEVEVVGQANASSLAEKIQHHYFSMIEVFQPLGNFSFSENPHIICTPFIDLQRWNDVFNDQLFLGKSVGAKWTHLQVKKFDVLREFSAFAQPVATIVSSPPPFSNVLSSGPLTTDAPSTLEVRKRKAGRKPEYDWYEAELYVHQELETRGDFDDPDQLNGWKCQADLVRSVADHFSRKANGKVPVESLIRDKIRPMVHAWRQKKSSAGNRR